MSVPAQVEEQTDHQAVAPARLFGSRFAREIIRFMARIANPAITLLAGTRWLPGFGVLVHSGRRTGRSYRTPVGMGVAGGRFFVPLTFGVHSHWYQNVVAAGECSVQCRGAEHRVGHPVVVESAEARSAFPIVLWWLLRAVGIGSYMRLQPIGRSGAAL